MASAYTTGDPTKSLVQYKDGDEGFRNHDHSYFGSGCTNSWGIDGSDGSDIPCGINTAQTEDGENLRLGTYYHFQAATAGSGGNIEANNTNAPDTFCPLGWQLPYSGTGGDYYNQSKSWEYLFTTYGMTLYNPDSASSEKLHSYPMSYTLNGNYDWSTGRLYNVGLNTRFWSSTIFNRGNGYRLNSDYNNIVVNVSYPKFGGYGIRCFDHMYYIEI